MSGSLFWITGLSGAGKTTVGNLLYSYLKEKNNPVVFLDGDILREVYADKNYSMEGRKSNALRTSRLCKVLTEQGIDVIVCIIAMFDECRQWNKENIKHYHEIYLKVSMEELIRRDQKQLYSRALKAEVSNVMGIDLDFDEPLNPELVIMNEGDISPEEVIRRMIEKYRI